MSIHIQYEKSITFLLQLVKFLELINRLSNTAAWLTTAYGALFQLYHPFHWPGEKKSWNRKCAFRNPTQHALLATT